MSFDASKLKSASDDNIPSFLRGPENGTTSAIRHNTMYEWSVIGKGARIVNNDSLNNLDIRLQDPRAPPLVIPPNSDLNINEWFAQIHCEPDGVTGDFQITIEVAQFKDAVREFVKV